MEPSLGWIEAYLDGAEPYDEIHAMLFSHGVEAVGLPYRTLAGRPPAGTQAWLFRRLSERECPRDFASQLRCHAALKRVRPHYPLPEPLSLDRLGAFLERAGDRYPVRWS